MQYEITGDNLQMVTLRRAQGRAQSCPASPSRPPYIGAVTIMAESMVMARFPEQKLGNERSDYEQCGCGSDTAEERPD